MDPAIIGFIFSCIFGVINAYFAAQRGRNPYVWLAIGVFFGIFGVLALFLMPPVKQEKPPTTEPTKSFTVEEIPPEPAKLVLLKAWFCIDTNKAQLGPLNFDALKDLWKKGELLGSSYVWSEGMAAWLPIEQIPELDIALRS